MNHDYDLFDFDGDEANDAPHGAQPEGICGKAWGGPYCGMDLDAHEDPARLYVVDSGEAPQPDLYIVEGIDELHEQLYATPHPDHYDCMVLNRLVVGRYTWESAQDTSVPGRFRYVDFASRWLDGGPVIESLGD